MVRRTKKAKKRAVKRKKPAVRKKRKSVKAKAVSNTQAQWAAYRNLQKRVDKAWAKLRADVKKKAGPQALYKAKNHLMLLLGECNYMANECKRIATKWSRKR